MELRERALSILGLPKDAGSAEIRRTYRSLVRLCHPDLNSDNPDSQEKFKLISLAYAILLKRKAIGEYELSVFEHLGSPVERPEGKPYFEWWSTQFIHLL